MSRTRNNILKKRIVGAFVSSVISISLVLLLVGVTSVLAFNIGSIENFFKENIHITAFLKKGTSAEKAMALQRQMEEADFVKSTRYVSSKEGTEELVEMLGEDFADVFVNTPVPSSIEVLVKADYFDADSLDIVLKKIAAYPLVESATTQAAMVDSISEAMGQAAVVLAVIVALLMFISVVLISNTVRLNIYSSRFSIHTMQLVGASNSFIARPFLGRAALMGALSGLIACLIIAAGLLYVQKHLFSQVFELFQWRILLLIGGAIIILGVVICLLCARVVMGKVVKLDKDELYG